MNPDIQSARYSGSRVIALVAGEASGDQLGAALIRAIRASDPDFRFAGIGGPMMKAAGLDAWWDSDQLSVMGLFEVIQHIPRLMGLRSQLVRRLLELKPDVFIGIDAPDFNLGIEKRLKSRAIPVIHYVSPTVWAWRAGRVKTIARAADRVMCLFPFEPDYYRHQDVAADYTGHPLADEIATGIEPSPARRKLDMAESGLCVALLPGSRVAEVEKLTGPMLEAADILSGDYPEIRFMVPAATELIRREFEAALANYPAVDCRVFTTRAKDVMAAADVVICASGTATLETMLVNRPMVVCYRLAGVTYRLAKLFRLVKSKYFALPNILASEALVPELLQDQVSGERIAREASRWLDDAQAREDLKARFERIHRQLRIDAAKTAADVVLKHCAVSRTPAKKPVSPAT